MVAAAPTRVEVPAKLVFKMLVREIQEVDRHLSAFDLLQWMCDDSRYLADDCEFFFFHHDDGRLSEEEKFLLQWLRTMEQWTAIQLRDELAETAFQLDQNR